jgi:hypothetical protein
MLRADLQEPISCLLRGSSQYTTAFNDLEHRAGLAGFRVTGRLRLAGEFLLESAWTQDQPNAEIAFRDAAAKAGASWPW